jgi:hypothetical protein
MSYLFSFTKSGNMWAEQILSGVLVPVGGWKMWGKGVRGSIWCKYCANMYVTGKMRLVESIRGDKGEWWRDKFKYNIFDIS